MPPDEERGGVGSAGGVYELNHRDSHTWTPLSGNNHISSIGAGGGGASASFHFRPRIEFRY